MIRHAAVPRFPVPRFAAPRFAFTLAALAVMLGLQPAAAPAAPRAPTRAPAESPVIQMPHISVVATGKGTPVILIPGLSSPRAVWDAVAPDLARTHRVYLVQVNGFGGDAPRANLSPGMLPGIVDDLHTLIAAQKLAGGAVVGHSMGGLVALMLANQHPGDVGRVMVVDSLPFIGTLFAPQATVALVEPRASAMRDAQAATYGKPVDDALAQATADRLAATPAARALVAAWVKAADPRVSGQALYEDMTTDLRPAMAAITTPITLVYPWATSGPTQSQADTLYHAAYGDAPHVRFVGIGDAAHFVMLDQPARFAQALATFLAG